MNLGELQRRIRVGKDKQNSFGGYNYRTAEGILAIAKAHMPQDAFVVMTDTTKEVAGQIFLVSTATITFGDGTTSSATGEALHALTKKGMDPAQITGACSSYARKYALQGLFAIDDGSVDPDSIEGGYEPDEPTAEEKEAAEQKRQEETRNWLKGAMSKKTTQKQLHDFRASEKNAKAWEALPAPMQNELNTAYNDAWNRLPDDPALQGQDAA